jgi:hypothetical protein
MLIGKRSRLVIREHFVSTSLRTIEAFLDAENIGAGSSFAPGVAGNVGGLWNDTIGRSTGIA